MARDGKDSRLYGRFTLDFADSPKIAPLSDAAFRALIEMTLHSRRMLDDGFIDARIAVRKWNQEAIDELLTNDPDKPSLVIAEGGYMIHDFADHQQTRADIEKKREAGAKGGKASAVARAKAPANQVLKQNPTTPQAISETETETETNIVADRADVRELCNLLADLIEQNGSKRPTIGKTWMDSARLMLDKDKRDFTKTANLIRWSQESTFWKSTILSMPKFREQYDKLRLQALREHEEKRPRRDPDAWMNP